MRRIALTLFLLSTAAVSATPIDDKYLALGGTGSFLGAATINESPTPDGVGRFRHYKNGSIYWHPQTGAREVHGMIRQRWAELGWETSYLGYPMTDEIDLVDGGGRVSKFQGGQLVWRSLTNKVSEVKSTDLVVDLPFAVGEPWEIIQANAASDAGSHQGPFAYCWDMVLAGLSQPQNNGRKFVAAATAKLVHIDEGFSGPVDGNVIVQRFGEGRYGSYLHIKKGSYTKTQTGGGIPFLPQNQPWDSRPSPASGSVLGEVGDTGANPGAYHMHFCVTTTPDRAAYGPFESVPVAFRNYGVSTDAGQTWIHVPLGVPRNGQWVRRGTPIFGTGKPQVGSAQVLSRGTVNGKVVLSGDGKPAGAGKLVVRIMSAWGEPLHSKTLNVSATAPNGPWPFTFISVPAFTGMKISVSYEGPWSKSAGDIRGDSAPFNLAANGTAAPTATLKAGSLVK